MQSSQESLRGLHNNHPREFENFVYTYPVISRRSGGVSIGINLNLDKACNFDCPYCQVDRTTIKSKRVVNVIEIKNELAMLLASFDSSGVCRLEKFNNISDSAKQLKDIAISGDGESTMDPHFAEVCEMLAEFQKSFSNLEFKLILITNSTLLDRPQVQKGIDSLLSKNGEVWAKLDAGTEDWYQRINVSKISLDRIEENLIALGKKHSFKIQSLFCALDGEPPSENEINAYIKRLNRIKNSGSIIEEVQIHTLARKPAEDFCTPVTSTLLYSIKIKIENEVGILAQVYGVEN